jgi:DNA-binding HxlR family transcriptional regulator
MGRYPRIPAPALNRISPPLAGVLSVISARWGPLVIMALSDGHIRFNNLHRHLDGVSHKVLIETLRMLQREGIVCRVAIAEPVGNIDVAEYRLTEMGRDLLDWIEAIRRWAEMRRAA